MEVANKEKEFYIKLQQKLDEYREEKADADYEIVKENYDKFRTVYDCFLKFVHEHDAHIELLDLDPVIKTAGITMIIPMIDLIQDELKEFVNALNLVDVLNIYPSADDKVYIEVVIQNVWEEVPNHE